jgi:hypothetical protein
MRGGGSAADAAAAAAAADAANQKMERPVGHTLPHSKLAAFLLHALASEFSLPLVQNKGCGEFRRKVTVAVGLTRHS